MTFNINEKIFKFIFVKENQICMFAKNKIFLLKYELIFDDKNEGNLLNVNIYIIKEILLNENPFLDSLTFKVLHKLSKSLWLKEFVSSRL